MNINEIMDIKTTDTLDLGATPPTPNCINMENRVGQLEKLDRTYVLDTTDTTDETDTTDTTDTTDETDIIDTTDTTDTTDEIDKKDIPYKITISEVNKTSTITSVPYYNCIISSSDSNETNETHDSSETETEIEMDTSVETDTNENVSNHVYMCYNEKKEIDEEIQLLNYHKNKDCGYWKIAKMIISHSTKDKNNTEFFLDSLDIELHKNNDKLENIEKVFYTNNLDIDIVYEFEATIATFIVENLKLFKFKPLGYLFNKDVNQNKWDFTISVITSKSIYTYNRYITENQLGFY